MGEPARRGRLGKSLAAAAAALAMCLTAIQCSKSPTQPSPGGSNPGVPNTPTVPAPIPAVSEIFSGAGDIAICNHPQTVIDAEATASLLDNIGGTVFTLGDNAYPSGTPADFECYERSWGRHKGRTMATPGNHDYHDYKSPGADTYFRYFGSGGAGPAGLGYYSFNLGAWHIVSLNSNSEDASVQVSAGSAQASWLRQDLAAHPSKCTLAMWHHPLFSSGQNGDSIKMRDLYRILYDAGADVVLTGHDHQYERFGPQDPDGRPDSSRGIVQFVVGTGGVPLYDFRVQKPSSLVRIKEHGIIKLTLNPESYNFEFIAVGGGTRDFGADVACH